MIYYYRLGNEDNGFLWSGTVRCRHNHSISQAKRLIRSKLNMHKLPAKTIVISEKELKGFI